MTCEYKKQVYLTLSPTQRYVVLRKEKMWLSASSFFQYFKELLGG